MTVGDEDKLDAFHRKQLRRVLGKRYPDKISNKNLYETFKSIALKLPNRDGDCSDTSYVWILTFQHTNQCYTISNIYRKKALEVGNERLL